MPWAGCLQTENVMKPKSICVAAALVAFSAVGVPTRLMALEIAKDGTAATYLGALSQGSNYQVDANVRGDGFMRIFIINTNYGRFQVNGIELTKAFIQELRALDALEKMEHSDVFAKSFVNAATSPLRFGANLIVNPFGTIGGTVSGVANMFDRANASLANPRADRATAAESLLGVDDARRALAVALGVDPYTDFQPLATELTAVANAMAAGGITVKTALAVIPGGVTLVLSSVSAAQSLGDTLRDKTSAQIVQEVKSRLHQLGVHAHTIARFVGNRAYTPADMLAISRALGRLRAHNTQAFIDRAADANTREIAFFQRSRAQLLADRSSDLGGIADFTVVAGVPLNRTRAGNIVAAFPFDDLAWTANVERPARAVTSELRRDGLLARKPILATTGAVTPTASSELQKLGWQVMQLR
jgi:hypothetical protein